MAKKKTGHAKKKPDTAIRRMLRIVSGIAVAVAFFFVTGYLIDYCAKRPESPVGPNGPLVMPPVPPSKNAAAFFSKNRTGQSPGRAGPLTQHRAAQPQSGSRKPQAGSSSGKTPPQTGAPAGTAAAGGGTYTIQLGSFKSAEGARSFSRRLEEKGLSPYTAKVVLPGRGTLYRVRIGAFSSMEQAQRAAADVEQKAGTTVLITSH